ncbi:hypothetical protein ACWEPM_19030 [Streptomyces sp. NPDC004244]
MAEAPNDTYIDLSGLVLTTSYLLPSGSPMQAVIHGANFAFPKPLWVSVGAGGPEYLDASLLFGLRQRGQLVLGGAITGPPVIAAVREIVRGVLEARIAARTRPDPAQPPSSAPPSSVPSSAVPSSTSDSVDEEDGGRPRGRSRWEDSDDDEPAPQQQPPQPVRQVPGVPAAPQQRAVQGPTAEEIGARMAPGQRFVTPRGRACSFSDRGDSALRHFHEYQRSRKEQTAVFFSNVRRYSPLEYWETLLTMCDRAIDLYAMGAAQYGHNCVVLDDGGRPWTIGLAQADRGYRLTHAHFENYQNS